MATQTRIRSSASNVTRISAEEFCCLAVTTLGILCLLNLLVTEELPLATVLMGWTAPYLGISFVAAGVISLLGHRSQRWHIEAALGAVILLVALMAGSFVWKQSNINWAPILDGSLGGLFGQALGNTLLASLGRTAAGIVINLVAMGGIGLLVRYSPLMAVPIAMQGILIWALGRMRSPSSAVRLAQVPKKGTNVPKEAMQKNRAASSDKPILVPQVKEMTPKSPSFLSNGTSARPAPQLNSTFPADQAPNNQADEPPEHSAPLTAQAEELGDSLFQFDEPTLRSKHYYDERPSHDLLASHESHGLEEGAQDKALELEKVYEEFNLPVEVVSIEVGPAVTRFGVQPKSVKKNGLGRPVKVVEILARQDDVALALKAETLNYRAPVPGRPFIGIEVPNSYRQMVGLRGVLDSWEFTTKRGSLKIAMGRDATGKAVVTDLLTAPHLLVGGATGTGKSTFINSLLISLLMQHGPDTLNLILVDPKRVEMDSFAGLPHLVGRVVTDRAVASQLLLWLMLQMEARYEVFRNAKVRNILGYNQMARMRQDVEVMPFLVLVIDELAELLVGHSDIADRLCRLAQKCRATGIHIVLATQRPSTNVITGTIKANFPARVAFSVSSQVDSRVILDDGGAEALLGRGDMLYRPQGRGHQMRLQGSLVDEQDVKAVVDHWKQVQRKRPEKERVATWRGLLEPAM